MAKDFKTRSPMELVARLIMLQEIRKIPVKDIAEINPTCVMEYDEGEGTEVLHEVNWEELIFEKPNQELDTLLARYQDLKKFRDVNT